MHISTFCSVNAVIVKYVIETLLYCVSILWQWTKHGCQAAVLEGGDSIYNL